MQKKVKRKWRKAPKIGKRPLHFAPHLGTIQQEQMYRKSNQPDLTLEKFELPVAISRSEALRDRVIIRESLGNHGRIDTLVRI